MPLDLIRDSLGRHRLNEMNRWDMLLLRKLTDAAIRVVQVRYTEFRSKALTYPFIWVYLRSIGQRRNE